MCDVSPLLCMYARIPVIITLIFRGGDGIANYEGWYRSEFAVKQMRANIKEISINLKIHHILVLGNLKYLRHIPFVINSSLL